MTTQARICFLLTAAMLFIWGMEIVRLRDRVAQLEQSEVATMRAVTTLMKAQSQAIDEGRTTEAYAEEINENVRRIIDAMNRRRLDPDEQPPQTTHCIKCLGDATRWSGHVHMTRGTAIAGWCDDCQGQPLPGSCRGCFGEWKAEMGLIDAALDAQQP